MNDNYGIKSLQDPIPSDQVCRYQPQRPSFISQGSHHPSVSQAGLMKPGCLEQMLGLLWERQTRPNHALLGFLPATHFQRRLEEAVTGILFALKGEEKATCLIFISIHTGLRRRRSGWRMRRKCVELELSTVRVSVAAGWPRLPCRVESSLPTREGRIRISYVEEGSRTW